MILEIVFSVVIFYSAYEYYVMEEEGEQIEEDRRYNSL